MSSTGATLLGSYSGATGAISETGFWYGTSSENLQTNGTQANNTGLNNTNASGNFTKGITGLTPNTTYWYLAYVKEYNETVAASTPQSFKTKAVATATVSNSAASSVSQTEATLNGSFAGATGKISRTGFYYATSSANLNNANTRTEEYNDVNLTSESGSFNKAITGLTANTTYYYKAYVLEYDEEQGEAVQRMSSTYSTFTTLSQSSNLPAALTDYGMPDVSGLNLTLRQQASTRTDRDDYWYSYNTNNSNRQIAIHTYASGAPNNAETVNYVVLYDQTKYAPVWTAHTMNNTTWPRNNVGRNESWGNDPAISLTQQSGVSGYSKGHLVASNYRQTHVDQNKQTFYYSNQAPQYQNGFNGGVWENLENRVVTVSTTGTTMLYVITGVLYEGTITTQACGSLNVPIPSHFYKCIMQCTLSGNTVSTAKGIAFVYTNESHSGENYYDSAYVTSIDAIETRAGFDFFAAVPDNLEDSAESNTNHSWFTGQSSPSNVAPVGDNNWGSL